jgi:hypothetical protein
VTDELTSLYKNSYMFASHGKTFASGGRKKDEDSNSLNSEEICARDECRSDINGNASDKTKYSVKFAIPHRSLEREIQESSYLVW